MRKELQNSVELERHADVKAVGTESQPTLRLPLASELERPLSNGLADRLVGGDGVEPFGLRFVVGSQEVNQTQGLTLRSQRRKPRHNDVSRFAKSELVAVFGILLKS